MEQRKSGGKLTQQISLAVVAIGSNPTPLWGMSNAERIRRISEAAGLSFGAAGAGPRLLIDTDYAFDPSLLRYMAAQPDTALVRDGRIVMASITDTSRAAEIAAAMERKDARAEANGLTVIPHEDGFTLYNDQLRKREQPFLIQLNEENVGRIERASYYGAYKGVTDLLTKYLWRELALLLTRLAARIGMTPNMVTAIGAALCLWATWLFWHGQYWEGLAAGFTFMVLDTVDGKLARCTITSSKLGNILDHGVDLVHPPFWYWAWIHGLGAVGLAVSRYEFFLLMGVLVAGYVLQRVVEGIFIAAFDIHIHVWRRFDSWFRLITARRNPNMLILFFSLLVWRPDLGIIAVTWWTAISFLIHVIRLVQALLVRARGEKVTSWLQTEAG